MNIVSLKSKMPNPHEGIIDVLSKLDEEALFSLARTVTQGLKKSGNVEEAIQNIINYSPDYLSILRRKALTRDVLFSYLEDNNIKLRLPVTKNDLIDAVADIWNISRIGLKHRDTDVVEASNSAEIDKEEQAGSNINVMAEQFSKWFYSMLNCNECGAEHFFPDAKLKLNLHCNSDCETTEVENNPEEIANTLLKIRLQHKLHFNLNNSTEGIQGRSDPHGLVMVMACGTLHVLNICTGVFEQVFALARDPFSENNWKIKNTELNLRSRGNILESPKLTDSELTRELLMLPCE